LGVGTERLAHEGLTQTRLLAAAANMPPQGRLCSTRAYIANGCRAERPII